MRTTFASLKQTIFIALIGLLISTAANSATILVLGDSLSAGYGIDEKQGWVYLLQQQLGDNHQLINASISGETTSGGLSRLPVLLESYRPDYVLIELGGNDGLRGYSIKLLKANLQALIAQSRANQAIPLILPMQIPPNYGQRYSQAFADAFGQVATAEGVGLLPFVFEEVMAQPALLQQDGIHPTAEAQPLIAEEIRQALSNILKLPPTGQ